MKILKSLSISLLLGAAIVNSNAFGKNNTSIVNFSEIPAKTVCIKNPNAVDVNKFFSETTILSFEIYKPGSKEEITKIINSLKKDAAVETVSEGKLTGDYQSITLTLKSTKNKAWFAAEFKKAGLNTIRINNNPIVEVDKM
ncbi:MAG: hypothetical protein Q7W45_08115 [Bacteroidota bacterium]|nr:hypothetical protein [Bacteroidota bacterium]MDP3147184.1 hypothetical protein [Bacteroidota bacterium]MDP3557309.1 hypothetical protein [Bacteroidota bacterium]